MALALCGARGEASRPGVLRAWRRLLPARRPLALPPPGEEGEAATVVRVPVAWQLRRARAAPPRPAAPRGKLLLRSRRAELSQAARQTAGRWERPRLVSAGWKHRLSRGDFFQLERAGRAPAQEQGPGAASFPALGLGPLLAAALEGALGVSRPTAVQRRAIPALLAGASALCAAEPGSGKTLAYLAPLLQRLLDAPAPAPAPASTPAPRALVLLPSRELAGQVRSVAAPLCARLGLQTREVGGGRGMGAVRRRLRSGPADLLVATPGALYKALWRRMLTLQRLVCLVLDEVDTLLDPTFVDLVEDILQQAPLSGSLKEVHDVWDPRTQLVAMGATLPKGLGDLLSKVTDVSRFSVLTSHSLHRLQPHVEQKFMRLKGSDKVAELLPLIKDRSPSSGAVLVFCNSASTVNWLGYILDDHKVKHLRLQGQMPAAMRIGIFDTFQKGQADILVCTDIASRGLDTTRVELVVNYDFPPTLHDYLHRVGRVGRTGSQFPGTAISFVTHRWDVDLVRKIETAARKRVPLPGMDPVVKMSLISKN
ncbi:probable ATP-dependent RNA helicase DDX28 [Tiliqua scincoides]|uniref:probable ATP-dependent RNA helicase DDX28 n=1 Tax=Tiliqua scincoides TaxID=71010 RepID=UPI0034623D49